MAAALAKNRKKFWVLSRGKAGGFDFLDSAQKFIRRLLAFFPSERMKLLIKDDPEALARRLRELQKLKNKQVKVGLPESAGGHLRFILAVQQHGSPLMRIPARPVIQPALAKEETRAAMAEEFRGALEAAWKGRIRRLPWRKPGRPARTASAPISIPISRRPTVPSP